MGRFSALLLASLSPTSLLLAQIGTLDASFSGDGIISTDLGASTFDKGAAVTIQEDGRIVVVGTSGYDKAYDFGATRYLPDGTPDAEFSFNGEVFTSVVPGNDQATAVAMQDDGKIIVGGFGLCTEGNCFAMVRYLPDGSLDDEFGNAGIVTTEFSGGYTTEAKVIAVQEDGKILLAGGGIAGFSVVRYLEDGTVDTDFGTDGLATCAFSQGNDRVTGMNVLADGKIILSGYASGLVADSIAVARLLTDGTVDDTFAIGGRVRAAIPGRNTIGQALAVGPGGELVVAGYYVPLFTFSPAAMVARFTPDGILDETFNGTGLRDLAPAGSDASILNGLAVQSDGKVVAAGAVTTTTSDFYIVRLNVDGTDDLTFNTTGSVATDFTGTTDRANAMTLQDDGRIVVVGETSAGSEDSNFAVARYLNDVGLGIGDPQEPTSDMQVYPQPIRSGGHLLYSLKENDRITITLCDARGANVRSIEGPVPRQAGSHRQSLDQLETLPSGIYFLQLRGQHVARTIKVALE